MGVVTQIPYSTSLHAVQWTKEHHQRHGDHMGRRAPDLPAGCSSPAPSTMPSKSKAGAGMPLAMSARVTLWRGLNVHSYLQQPIARQMKVIHNARRLA